MNGGGRQLRLDEMWGGQGGAGRGGLPRGFAGFGGPAGGGGGEFYLHFRHKFEIAALDPPNPV